MQPTEQCPQGQAATVHQHADDAESVTRATVMRGQCERALAAWYGPPALHYDYGWRVKQLSEEWQRLIYEDDLPRRIREAAAVVKDRAGAKRVVRAMLRRLDRIEGIAPEQRLAKPPEAAHSELPAKAAAPQDTSPGAAPLAEPSHGAAVKKLLPRQTTEQRMREIIDKNPEALLWSITRWTAQLRRARSTIHDTETWRRCREAQEAVRRRRMEEQRKWQRYKGPNE
jgi:hypothetical protein